MDAVQVSRIRSGLGLVAALDQSGGSTPKALADYGIPDRDYRSQEEMFDLIHAMRTRIISDPAFDGSRVLAAILFRETVERTVGGVPTARYLWERKQVVPFLKVDEGLADEHDGVQLMKPLDRLDDDLELARREGILGTKTRSLVNDADERGVTAIVDQQFEYAARIGAAGFLPILEPEVSIRSPRKDDAEALLVDALQAGLDRLPDDAAVLLKLTIPSRPGRYAALAADRRVLRVLALSGGYHRDEACALLARDPFMIASFSRALLEDLSAHQPDEEFHRRLDASIAEIYAASVDKSPASRQ